MSFAKGTDTNPYITEPGNISPNKDLEYWLFEPQYTFPPYDGPSKMPLSPEKSTLEKVNMRLLFLHSDICERNSVM